jgi:hypothetical protein
MIILTWNILKKLFINSSVININKKSKIKIIFLIINHSILSNAFEL